MKKVTVWGGGGFLGSHICDALTLEGHRVTIVDIADSLWKKEGQSMIIADLMDYDEVVKTVENADYVFNLAGIADIGESNDDPFHSAKTNILGNINLLKACVKANVKRYIFASSIYVYSNSGGFYRCSKQACESYIDEYYKQYGQKYTILRFGSLYGLRSDERNAIYRFIKQAINKKKISYFGSPDALREYIHAEDAARICTKILDNKFINQHLTITGHQRMRVGDLFKMIQEIVGKELEFEFETAGGSAHYEITPYNFNPKLGLKYSSELHVDLGQGLLQIMDQIYKEHNEVE